MFTCLCLQNIAGYDSNELVVWSLHLLNRFFTSDTDLFEKALEAQVGDKCTLYTQQSCNCPLHTIVDMCAVLCAQCMYVCIMCYILCCTHNIMCTMCCMCVLRICMHILHAVEAICIHVLYCICHVSYILCIAHCICYTPVISCIYFFTLCPAQLLITPQSIATNKLVEDQVSHFRKLTLHDLDVKHMKDLEHILDQMTT